MHIHQLQTDEVVEQVAVAKQIVHQMQVVVVVKEVLTGDCGCFDFEQFLDIVLQELNPDGSLTAIGEIANVRVSGLVFFISFKA